MIAGFSLSGSVTSISKLLLETSILFGMVFLKALTRASVTLASLISVLGLERDSLIFRECQWLEVLS